MKLEDHQTVDNDLLSSLGQLQGTLHEWLQLSGNSSDTGDQELPTCTIEVDNGKAEGC